MKSSSNYIGIRVQQHPLAKPFYVLKATAEGLLQWCDVPRKKADYMAGYQRELGDRHHRIREFLEKEPLNVIPGAVIVATRPGRATVEPFQGFPDLVRITIHTEAHPFETQLEATYKEFLTRLSDGERADVEKPVAEGEMADNSSDEDVDDEGPPDSYLAILTRELRGACKDFNSLPGDRQKAVRDYVMGTSKPGLILDGQHRVFGAKEVADHAVELPVVLMPDLAPQEQVFHFYVLNNKAVPLRPTELRGTISTSLTNGEIAGLYDRLLQSGVKAEEARWTHRVNTDEASPFRGMIDFGFDQKSSFIPENVMFGVVSKFMKPPKRFRSVLLGDVVEWSNDPEYRMKTFFSFWSAIKEKYPKAWEEGRVFGAKGGTPQIFMKATMQVLQELIFQLFVADMPKRKQRNAKSPFANSVDLKESIKAELYYLPEDFFTRTWTETGLDTSERRGFLLGQMKSAIEKSGEKIGMLALFKTKTKSGGT